MAAKGYWLARININDKGLYEEYRKRNAVPFNKYGGRFLVRGGPSETVFGNSYQHNVVIEFDSYAQALACYRSPEYQDAAQFLKKGCDVELVIVDGYSGPQP
jgi:uncharacterized protein (DUF1330 family)